MLYRLKPFNQHDLNHKFVDFEELQREERNISWWRERETRGTKKKKKMTAVERMNLLFDSSTLVELD